MRDSRYVYVSAVLELAAQRRPSEPRQVQCRGQWSTIIDVEFNAGV